jgi:hypothetical protein
VGGLVWKRVAEVEKLFPDLRVNAVDEADAQIPKRNQICCACGQDGVNYHQVSQHFSCAVHFCDHITLKDHATCPTLSPQDCASIHYLQAFSIELQTRYSKHKEEKTWTAIKDVDSLLTKLTAGGSIGGKVVLTTNGHLIVVPEGFEDLVPAKLVEPELMWVRDNLDQQGKPTPTRAEVIVEEWLAKHNDDMESFILAANQATHDVPNDGDGCLATKRANARAAVMVTEIKLMLDFRHARLDYDFGPNHAALAHAIQQDYVWTSTAKPMTGGVQPTIVTKEEFMAQMADLDEPDNDAQIQSKTFLDVVKRCFNPDETADVLRITSEYKDHMGLYLTRLRQARWIAETVAFNKGFKDAKMYKDHIDERIPMVFAVR